jgi:hypothetical protein
MRKIVGLFALLFMSVFLNSFGQTQASSPNENVKSETKDPVSYYDKLIPHHRQNLPVSYKVLRTSIKQSASTANIGIVRMQADGSCVSIVATLLG